MTAPLLQASDLRAAASLATDAVVHAVDLVEAMHARIAGPLRLPGAAAPPAPDERAGGIAGLVYRSVRGVTHLVGGGTQRLFGLLAPVLARPDTDGAPRAEREAVLAALNGVLGDHLAARGNALAIDMRWRRDGRALPLARAALQAALPDATPRVLVLVHGLCMNDLQWRQAGHDHGETLARRLGYTAVYLHYNSGLGIATNGRQLAQCLDRLCEAWPVPIERLAVLGHSMGGLVARSALHHAALVRGGGPGAGRQVDDLVCLGTPHLGAPLEKMGHGLALLLGATHYAAPLARLGQLRSAGIRDLRHGNILGPSPGDDAAPPGPTVPLPSGTRCHAIAATLGPSATAPRSRLMGDGLVQVDSALGRHPDARRRLHFSPERTLVVPNTGHLALMSSPVVAEQLTQWLA